MPALKEIGKLQSLVGASSLAQSPLWEQAVESISSFQIHAFITRMSNNGKRDEAETAIDIAMQEVAKAVDAGQVKRPEMLSYCRPERIYLTLEELRDGFRYLGKLRAAAVLFGLEMKMDIRDVVSMTWEKYAEVRRKQSLTAAAFECIKVSPQHVSCPYVFWETIDRKAAALFGLDAAIFDAFGLIWAELVRGYADLIMIDGTADRVSLECLLYR